MADLPRIRFVTARITELFGLTALPWCAYGALDLAWHYGILDGADIAISRLIWTGLPRPVLYVIYQFAFIGGLAIAGIGDHLLLARTAPPPPPPAPSDEALSSDASLSDAAPDEVHHEASLEDSHAHAL